MNDLQKASALMKDWNYDKWKLEVEFRLDLQAYFAKKGIKI